MLFYHYDIIIAIFPPPKKKTNENRDPPNVQSIKPLFNDDL